MREVVAPAIEKLCEAFEKGGYNPTPIIDLGVLVAGADGTVDDKERELLLDVFQTLLETKINAEVVDHLVTSSLEVIAAAGSEARERLVAAILADCDAVEAGLLVALAIAFASEGLSSSERTVITRIARAAGLGEARLAELVRHVERHSDGDPMNVRTSLAPKKHA
jgi:tellurite resistance protein